MNLSKKKLEHLLLDHFKNLIPSFPSGKVICSEEPDFLVQGADHVVGIELTDLHRETKPDEIPEQASAAMRERVVSRAMEIYNTRSLPAVFVSFNLNNQIHIKKTQVKRIAEDLADLVAANLPPPNSTTEVSNDWNDVQVLPEILHQLSVRRFDWQEQTSFQSGGTTWLPLLTLEDVQRVLEKKESKYPTYRGKCDEVWLVVNIDAGFMTTWFQVDPEVLRNPFTTRFDRVFLVQYIANKVHVISVQSGGA